ncbi:FtsX-like permease family protein [Nitriliruptoraceae bacterium ZYF776]|nr:FtsX-like permease family protein [Profundirhabdus halotolerans]
MRRPRHRPGRPVPVNTTAVAAVSGRELRATWRRLLALGVLAGLGAAVVAAGVTVTHRTTTAYDRLLAATHAEDVRVTVMADAGVATQVARLPSVRRSWTGTAFVAQVLTDHVYYAGIVSGPDRPADLARPVVVDGRWYDDRDAQEVVIVEPLAAALGVGVGDRLPVQLLSTEEFGRFDVGFGEPDGASVDLEVVGLVRAEERTWTSTPIVASGAFAARHAAISAVARTVSIRLEPPADTDRFAAELAALTADLPPMPDGFEEFPHAAASYAQQGRSELAAATRALVGGMSAALVTAAAAILLAAGQAWGRLHASGAAAQRVERALGMTTSERVAARVLPAAAAAAVAGVSAAAGVAVGGWLEPLGRASELEPAPGWWGAPAVAAVAVAVTVVAMLLLAGSTALAAGRERRSSPVARRSRLAALLPDRLARPWTIAGLAFVADRGDRERGASAGSAGVGTFVALTGVVTVATFAASLHALGADPERWGWQGDLAILDATPELVDELVADPKVGAVTTYAQSSVTLGDGDVPAVSVARHVGALGWKMFDGRLPAADDEVALGAATARRLDLRVGDRVEVTDPAGHGHVLEVSGVGLGPAPESAAFAREVALTRATFDAVRRTEPFTTVHLAAAAGVDAERLHDRFGTRLEAAGPEAPLPVATLLGLSRLPAPLTVFLVVVAAAATIHGAASTARRRGRDLAILQALGATGPQARRSVRVTSLVATSTAVAFALPLGLAVGRLVWWGVAHDAGLDVRVTPPWWWLAALPPVALAVAVLAARVAASRYGRTPLGDRLR